MKAVIYNATQGGIDRQTRQVDITFQCCCQGLHFDIIAVAGMGTGGGPATRFLDEIIGEPEINGPWPCDGTCRPRSCEVPEGIARKIQSLKARGNRRRER